MAPEWGKLNSFNIELSTLGPQGALDWQVKYWHKRIKMSVT